MSYDITQATISSYLQLISVRGLGSLSFGRLMATFGSAQIALEQQASDWQAIGISEKIYHAAQKPIPISFINTIERWLSQSDKHHILSYGCVDYPAPFKELADPPAILYARGNLSALREPNIAIIGSRQATPLGLKTTQKFAYELSTTGLSICSGLALGIDTCAHLGALSAKGNTVAFLGTGVDVIYPKSNSQMAEKMIDTTGILVSELPLGTHPKGSHFPPRNRLICGLSTCGVLVVESKAKGGSMITARLAAEQGRDLFAVPGSIQSPLSAGCHHLIQQGAKLVQNTQDILQELSTFTPPFTHHLSPQNTSQHSQDTLSKEQQTILTAMSYEVIRIEDIAKHTALSVEQLSIALLELELQGKIKALSGHRWQRIA